MLKIGQIVYFSVPKSNRDYYVDWFIYAVEHHILARVTAILEEGHRVECEFLSLEGRLRVLKDGGPTIYTDYENVVPVSLYEEV